MWSQLLPCPRPGQRWVFFGTSTRCAVSWCQLPTLPFCLQVISGCHWGGATLALCQNKIASGKHPAGPGAGSADGRLPPGQSLSSSCRPACAMGGGRGSKSSIMFSPSSEYKDLSVLSWQGTAMTISESASRKGFCQHGCRPGLLPWGSAWQLEVWLCSRHVFG